MQHLCRHKGKMIFSFFINCKFISNLSSNRGIICYNVKSVLSVSGVRLQSRSNSIWNMATGGLGSRRSHITEATRLWSEIIWDFLYYMWKDSLHSSQVILFNVFILQLFPGCHQLVSLIMYPLCPLSNILLYVTRVSCSVVIAQTRYKVWFDSFTPSKSLFSWSYIFFKLNSFLPVFRIAAFPYNLDILWFYLAFW